MPQDLLVPLILMFASIAIATGGIAYVLLGRTDPVRRRLRAVGGPSAEAPRASVIELTPGTQGTTIQQLESALPKSPKEMSRLRQRLVAAGYKRPEVAVIYALAEILLPIVFGYIPIYILGWTNGWILALFVAAMAYMAPGLWLGHQMTKRKKEIRNGLPDALDMLLVCVEAGSGLDQSLVRVSQELETAYPALAEELRQTVSEMRAGRQRAEALRNLADRTKVEDVRTLVSTLVQTDRFGTSLGPALRTHAEVSRTKRRQRAEERAQKIGVKLVFPLVFCLFPAMYVVVLGPVVIKIVRVFFGEFAQ